MNDAQALVAIWNPDSTPKDVVRAACAHVLGSIDASVENVEQATLVLAYIGGF